MLVLALHVCAFIAYSTFGSAVGELAAGLSVDPEPSPSTAVWILCFASRQPDSCMQLAVLSCIDAEVVFAMGTDADVHVGLPHQQFQLQFFLGGTASRFGSAQAVLNLTGDVLFGSLLLSLYNKQKLVFRVRVSRLLVLQVFDSHCQHIA